MHPHVDIKAIIEEFGPPGYENAKGQLTKLNEPFWAAYFAKSRERIIFEPLEREFYDYQPDGLFIPKSADAIRAELAALMYNAAKNFSGFGALEQMRTTGNLAATVSHLRGQIEARDFFNHVSNCIHLGNCTLKFKDDGSFSVEGFSPEHRSRNRSPINYDSKATCPEFEKKLLSHVSDDDKTILQKYSGQCLLGRNLIQRFLILDGVGGSSKSAFVLVLNGIIGPQNSYELRTRHLSDRFEIGRMIGRTLLIGPDVKGNFLSVPGSYLIKSLVGGDQLDAELKGSNGKFHIYGIFNLVITSNGRLLFRLDSDQSAWLRRLLIARYEKPYTGQRIFEIERYLLTREAPGILNWCIKGVQMLLADYAQVGDIILPQSQQDRISSLLGESDSLRIFVSSEIVRDDSKMANGDSYSLTTEEIVTEYFDECVNTRKWIPVPKDIAEKELPDMMLRYFNSPKTHGLQRQGTKNLRGFRHVRFN